MRIWTIHPKYLDRQGLLALWREALLAQKVLLGRTVGYLHHPQLTRFRRNRDPVSAISAYLREVHKESVDRGYKFDSSKIHQYDARSKMRETKGQLLYEWRHFLAKVRDRSPDVASGLEGLGEPDPHPLFVIVSGPPRDWERCP